MPKALSPLSSVMTTTMVSGPLPLFGLSMRQALLPPSSVMTTTMVSGSLPQFGPCIRQAFLPASSVSPTTMHGVRSAPSVRTLYAASFLTSFVCHDDDNGFRSAPLRIIDAQRHQILRVNGQALQRVALGGR
jgi:hypothetical protein